MVRNDIFYGLKPLLLRNFLGWRPYMTAYYLRLVEAPINLYGYGLGLATLAAGFGAQNYAAFMFPGMIAFMLWLAVIIDTSYITYSRAYTHRIWQATLMTPVRLPAILISEQVMSLLKGLSLLLLIYPIGWLFHAIPSHIGFWLALVPYAAFILVVTALGHWMTSMARNEYDFDYIWPVFVAPMFIFSGFIFPITLMPYWLQWLAWVFPMTHVIAAARPLMLGDWHWLPVVGHTGVLIVMWLAASALSYIKFKARMEE